MSMKVDTNQLNVLTKAVMFWQKRCDELIKALEMLEKIFADTDFIEEEEQEDFLFHVWTLAHGALYNFKRELALEREYLELMEREAVRDGAVQKRTVDYFPHRTRHVQTGRKEVLAE